jgi:Raf kinase inhibitor-like YbhB/YbcL family protein
MKLLRATMAVAAAVLTPLVTAGCGSTAPVTQAVPEFTVASPDVTADGLVPDWAIGSFGGFCDGENRSINLRWSNVPEGTKSFVVLMVDDSYTHWVVTDIPATVTELAAADGGQVSVGVVGKNLSGPTGYIGPCVAGHQYVYTAYALDVMLNGTTETEIEAAKADMEGHILAESSLTTMRS